LNGNIIPFAVIRAFKEGPSGQKEYVGQTVADVDARYSLYLSEASSDVKLEVEAPGYKPEVMNIEGLTDKKQAFNVNQDISLTRIDQKPGKKGFNYNRIKLYKILIWTVYLNSILYFLTFVYYFLAWYGETYAVATLIVFTYAVIRNTKTMQMRFFAPKGKIIDASNKKPLAGVTVDFFKDGQKLESISSDEHGIIKSSLEKGKHDVSITKLGFKVKKPIPWRVTENSYFVKIKIDKEGYLEEDIYLEAAGEKALTSSSNPFS
jgi:hypothetical protein